MVRGLDLQIGGPEFRSDRALPGFVLGCPEFKYTAMFVTSQLVCLRPFGILNPVMFDLNY